MIASSLALAGTAGATPRKWYWTETHAEAAAVAKARIPFCRIIPTDSRCNSNPNVGYYHPAPDTIACTGKDERGDTFTFARFSCRFTVGYMSRQTGQWVQLASGRLALWPTGASTFRSSLLSITPRG